MLFVVKSTLYNEENKTLGFGCNIDLVRINLYVLLFWNMIIMMELRQV